MPCRYRMIMKETKSILPMIKKWKEIYAFVIYIIVFFVSIIPLLICSLYNHMYADDFRYMREANLIVSGEGGVLGKGIMLLHNAVESAALYWRTWSGCYSSYFFCAFSPGCFGEGYVWMNTIILLGIFIIATVASFKLIVIDVLKVQNATKAYLVMLSALFVSIQFVPSTAEAFYWYNGSFYNVAGYSAGLLLFAIIIKMSDMCQKRICKKYLVSALLLAIFFGGTNYSSILLYMVLYVGMVIYIVKNQNIVVKCKIVILGIIGIFYGCSFFSIAAPGNAVRQTHFVKPTAIEAICMALRDVGVWIKEYTSITMLLVVALAIPLFFDIVRNTRYHYNYPWIVALVSYVALGIIFTPTEYSMANLGPMRTQNVYYFFYIVLLYINVFYICGWFYKHCGTYLKISKSIFKYIRLFVCVCLILSIGNLEKSSEEIACVSALNSIITGEIKEYDRQLSERRNLLGNAIIGEVEVPELTVNPHILTVTKNEGLSEDPEYWVNKLMATYFGVEKIISVPSK